MKLLKDLKYNMYVYVVGHVSHSRKNDLHLHDDNVKIKIMAGSKSLGKLRTDGHLSILNTQQFNSLMKEILDEEGCYPDDIDVLKIHNPEPTKIYLGLQSGKTLQRSGVNYDKLLSFQSYIEVNDLFISFDESVVSHGIMSLEESLTEDMLME